MKHTNISFRGTFSNMGPSPYEDGLIVVGWMNTRNSTGGQRAYKSKLRATLKLITVTLTGK